MTVCRIIQLCYITFIIYGSNDVISMSISSVNKGLQQL